MFRQLIDSTIFIDLEFGPEGPRYATRSIFLLLPLS
jgi:hypothetical protein